MYVALIAIDLIRIRDSAGREEKEEEISGDKFRLAPYEHTKE